MPEEELVRRARQLDRPTQLGTGAVADVEGEELVLSQIGHDEQVVLRHCAHLHRLRSLLQCNRSDQPRVLGA